MNKLARNSQTRLQKSETEIYYYYMKPVSVEFKFQDIPTGDVINIHSNLNESKSCRQP